MAYEKTVWEDEVLDGAERFEILDNLGDAVDDLNDLTQCQIKLKTPVTKAGTSVDADNLNNIEQGIEDISTGAARSVKGVAGEVAGDVADIQAGVDGYVLRRSGNEIGFGQVGEAGIDNGAVTEGKIGTGAVTETKIGSGAVSSGKIGSGAVTNAKIGSGAVTPNKTSFMNSNGAGAGIYVGHVNENGVAIRLPSGWSVTEVSTGSYELTHNLGSSQYVCTVTPVGTFHVFVITTLQTNQVLISTSFLNVALDEFVPASIAWNFVLVRY
jgi:hypothetical protein